MCANDARDVLFLAGAVDGAKSIDRAISQVLLVALASDTAEHHRYIMPAEEGRLHRVLSVAKAQLSTHHHRLQQAPSVTANRSPVAIGIDLHLNSSFQLVSAAANSHINVVVRENLLGAAGIRVEERA